MKKIMNILMLSCKKASGLIEKKSHFPLSPIEKIQLIMHTRMCDACKNYQKQSKDMDSLLIEHIHSNPQTSDSSDEVLTDDFKKLIIKKSEENK